MSAAGFIVCAVDWGDPLVLLTRSNSVWKKVPAAGILLRESRTAEIFPSRGAARAAIRRTETYFEGRGNSFNGFEIRRLVTTAPRKGSR